MTRHELDQAAGLDRVAVLRQMEAGAKARARAAFLAGDEELGQYWRRQGWLREIEVSLAERDLA